ncbi:MAG: hypothetical protein KGL48_02405 [Sphingomonadales bacterium]|nr:hypothetical protein [Sphingomonadales bacterium]MDE2569684.1 hypothetical protein [Sphingomonadales bacterium]
MAKNANPNELFGQMLSQWETASNELANRFMGSGEFSKSMSAATAMSLKMRETIHEQMTRFLEATNMPSRDEVTELTRMVAALGDQLRQVEAKIDRLAGTNAATPVRNVKRPARTRRPPAKPASAKAGKKDG